MSISISYRLTGPGWSECTVRVDEVWVTVTASYLSDALGDLVRAMNFVLRENARASASFSEEPGEYRWILEPLANGRLQVRILEFPQLFGDRPDEEGTQIFSAHCRLRTFAGALLSELQRLEEAHGLKGYLELWCEHEFPKTNMDELKNLLEKKEL